MRYSRLDQEAKDQVEGSIQRVNRAKEPVVLRSGGRATGDRESQARFVLAVQRTAGNQAAIQRLDLAGKAADAILEKGFQVILNASINSSSPLTPDSAWDADIDAYALYNAADGAKLTAGRSRSPSWHLGGTILAIQSGAAAMTLDRDIFVASGHWKEEVYVHELVHVPQYSVGRATFLKAYFGLSAVEIAKRFAKGQPMDPFTASPFETEAYGVEGRFIKWLSDGKPGPGSAPVPSPSPTPPPRP